MEFNIKKFNIKVILVEPSGPINVGSIARLCSNFNVDELRVVSPKCDIFSLEVKKMALKGIDYIHESCIYKDLNSAIIDCDMVFATCGRISNSKESQIYTLNEIYSWIKKHNFKSSNNLAIVFGREDRGLNNKELLSNKVAVSASIIAKDPKIRKIVKKFQLDCAYNPPKKFLGSVLDGRDITSVIMKDAMFKFYITANIEVRAKRRFIELRKLKKKISYKEVLKSLKNRDYLDKKRKFNPLKKTKDSILINTSKLSKKSCFIKIKAIIDKELKINGSI